MASTDAKVAAGADAKVLEAKGASAADPGGAVTGPAPVSGQSREPADGAAADRKAAPDEETQPGSTVRSPVAGPFYRVSSKALRGRRRSGIAFGREPLDVDSSTLSPRELDRLLADPELIVEDIATPGASARAAGVSADPAPASAGPSSGSGQA